MFLGGAMQQIPAIKRAKEWGIYVIICDYLMDNPGQQYADEYYNISTTDKDAVLHLAKKIGIDGIVAYASDPAAPTAAYVANQLSLPGNPYESVNILTQKDLFRDFLQKNGFNCPKAASYHSYEEALKNISLFSFPVMVKPVDASGSKGVVKVEKLSTLQDAVKEALSYSRRKKFIIEEFISKKGYQVSGDGFSVDGKLVFTSYGNELYSSHGGTRDYVALGEFWPTLLHPDQKMKVDAEIQRIISKLHMRTGAYNIEVILDKNDKPFVIELGPRNGGSYIPQLIKYATGIDLIDFTIKAALGESCNGLHMVETIGCWSNYMIYSEQSGKFDSLWFDESFKNKNLLEVHCTAKSGDLIHKYANTSHSLGTILFKGQSVDEMIHITQHMNEYYKVKLQNT